MKPTTKEEETRRNSKQLIRNLLLNVPLNHERKREEEVLKKEARLPVTVTMHINPNIYF